ncbi:tRNA (adenosine(37)-N6)-threonylcarbamoyltransferase complex ATPase subunit type 1 TsaE [Candidatus Saccharibacteria bacterium]|nr:tRNA (adenosine(37)-N6)-threonylcarbamoyltransferase complex ATPase subunit type 1 TsaE [Candidatus Saccharibacteria bacterium]
MKINSEQEMIKIGASFFDARIIELIGDVGVGKTTFVRGLGTKLGVKEPITSPSYTISKSYACDNGKTLVHYDFYRLKDPGLMMEDLRENLENPDNVVVVEWSDSVKNILPEERTIINIKYNDDGSRELERIQ